MTISEQLIRIALYGLFAAIGSQGIAVYDEAAGTLTFQVEHLTMLAVGALGFTGTLTWWRVRAEG